METKHTHTSKLRDAGLNASKVADFTLHAGDLNPDLLRINAYAVSSAATAEAEAPNDWVRDDLSPDFVTTDPMKRLDCAWVLKRPDLVKDLARTVARVSEAESKLTRYGMQPQYVDRLTLICDAGLAHEKEPGSLLGYAAFALRFGFALSRYTAQMERSRRYRVKNATEAWLNKMASPSR